MTDGQGEFRLTNARRRRDWLSPLLLTLSLHLMFFTLLINQRLLQMAGQVRGAGEYVLHVGMDKGADDEASDEEAGAAAGTPAAQSGQPRSVNDALKETAAPVVARREAAPEPRPEAAPEQPSEQPVKDKRSLAERLAGSVDSAGGGQTGEAGGVQPGGGSHGLRGQGRHGTGLKRNGGSAQTENAVELGLQWLASVQDSDGRWDSDGFMVHYLKNPTFDDKMAEGPGGTYRDIGITGLCLLAFTGAGYTEDDRRYGRVVKGARDWLLLQQRPQDGGFGLTSGSDMYDHALASLALADLYLSNGDKALRQPVKRALLFMLSQQGPGGGWDYSQGGRKPRAEERNDLSITGWCVLALVAGREAGFDLPEDNLRLLTAFLRKATREDGEGIYADASPRSGQGGLGMTAVSNVCRRLLGEPAASPMQDRQLTRLARNAPDWSRVKDATHSSFYYWYYGSVAMLLARDEPKGQDRWREWNIGLKHALLNNQVKSGGRRGSFDPLEFWAQHGGGRLYATAINVLSLEIYYRLEPEFVKAKAAELGHLWK